MWRRRTSAAERVLSPFVDCSRYSFYFTFFPEVERAPLVITCARRTEASTPPRSSGCFSAPRGELPVREGSAWGERETGRTGGGTRRTSDGTRVSEHMGDRSAMHTTNTRARNTARYRRADGGGVGDGAGAGAVAGMQCPGTSRQMRTAATATTAMTMTTTTATMTMLHMTERHCILRRTFRAPRRYCIADVAILSVRCTITSSFSPRSTSCRYSTSTPTWSAT